LDLRRIVSIEEGTDWIVDRMEIEDAAPAAMQSACQVPERARLGLGRWLDARIEAEGGPAEDAYERAGRDLGAISTLLNLERMRAVLRYASDHEEECPFWLEADDSFAGVHSDAGRFVLLLESAGGGGIVVRGDEVALAGGGGGRILAGWGLNWRFTLAAGLEAGGIAGLTENEAGDLTVAGAFAAAAPLVLRIRTDGLFIYGLEVAPTMRFRDTKVNEPGIRAGLGLGISGLRGGSVMPHGLLMLFYEFQPPRHGATAEHSVRVGTAIGLDWAP